ncbi:E3 ubiquitin-protein ligase UHRF1 [Neolecta irregularis DAH-3]|uniref:E3 ubiquitin-protein ligase UHRF1 n=1 Tax=Neolecta irregularis (strain DAH-3) TaxID=1198029 RepID=A0A1U7LSV4_NEOID|nr:E3 ubiquitin-protein ligase UHRF1 [Neolecta irregularis DAH-3]|eukprot:OLL25756.1 E3 ubiquitin-protein ligase UHRF1 [Neolecta irregularis DAH-3]
MSQRAKSQRCPRQPRPKTGAGAWHASAAQKNAPLLQKTTLAPSPGSKSARRGNSEWASARRAFTGPRPKYTHQPCRPPVGGIAGSANAGGAQSIVLAAGYPEDIDDGDSFVYTGSGGRDLKTGNRRTAEQTLDQTLAKQNLALAMTCDAPINPNKGAEAKNWKNSKPVRVVRTEKLKKHHPKFAPDQGCRYDGIYRLKRYWPEKGSTGFIVWRYEFFRDDKAPAPWTVAGKKLIAELGLEMVVPDNYNPTTDKQTKDDPKSKRKADGNIAAALVKKSRKLWEPSASLKKLIDADKVNARTWQAILTDKVLYSMGDFIEALQSHFTCPVCYDFVKNPPVSTYCGHTACRGCLESSVEGFGPKCPSCRTSLLKAYTNTDVNAKIDPQEEEARKTLWRKEVKPNHLLIAALKAIIPTYDA